MLNYPERRWWWGWGSPAHARSPIRLGVNLSLEKSATLKKKNPQKNSKKKSFLYLLNQSLYYGHKLYLQGDQLNMVPFKKWLVQCTRLLFTRYTAMFNWSPCMIYPNIGTSTKNRQPFPAARSSVCRRVWRRLRAPRRRSCTWRWTTQHKTIEIESRDKIQNFFLELVAWIIVRVKIM